MTKKPRLPRNKYNPVGKPVAQNFLQGTSTGSSTLTDKWSESLGTAGNLSLSIREQQVDSTDQESPNHQKLDKTSSTTTQPPSSPKDGEAESSEINPRKSENERKWKKKQKKLARKFKEAKQNLAFLESLGFDVLPSQEFEKYNNRKEELISIAKKYKVSGEAHDRVWIFDVDDFRQRRGGQPIDWEGKVITEEDIRKQNFLILRHGTTYGYRVINDRRELVFACRFTPFSSMSKTELRKTRMCGRHFNRTFQLFNPVKTNAAHRNGGSAGMMAAEGWRAGYEKGIDYGLYKRKHASTKDEKRHFDLVYRLHTAQMKFVSEYYEQSFENLCPAARKQALHWMETNKMPQFGAVTAFDQNPHYKSSGSNLTVTRGDFSNVFHRDKDASPFAFGIWFLMDSKGELIMDDETTRSAVSGGQFVLPEFKLAVDFASCTGKVDMMWRGSKDLHATAWSSTRHGFQRIGTSIQGSQRLLQKVEISKKKPHSKVKVGGLPPRLLP